MTVRPTLSIALTLLCALFLGAFATEFVDESEYKASPSQNKCTESGKDDPRQRSARPNSGAVKIIRLTNEGEFVDRCEFTDALFELTWDRPPPPSCRDERVGRDQPNCNPIAPTIRKDATTKPKLAVLFVHGWTHSARNERGKEDAHYQRFRELVTDLTKAYPEKQVVGFYVTWNASTGNAALDLLSFWSRQRIADRITQSAAVTKIVAAIAASRGVSGQPDQFIAIGHSFGARMLFAAVSAPLVLSVERAFPKYPAKAYSPIEMMADAVLLLNPAFEASRYTTIDSFMRNEETFPSTQRPLMMIISTDNDTATGDLFPLGQLAGLSFDKRARTTVGNYKAYYTHSLLRSAPGNCPSSELTEIFFEPNTELCLMREMQWHYDSSIAVDHRDPRRWSQVHPDNQKYNPFMVVRTERSVIDNHGGIWDSDVSPKWIFELLKAFDDANLKNLRPMGPPSTR